MGEALFSRGGDAESAELRAEAGDGGEEVGEGGRVVSPVEQDGSVAAGEAGEGEELRTAWARGGE